MREGYKDSVLGEIPVEWEVDTTESISEITSSKRIHQSEYIDSGIPFFRGKEITQLSKNEILDDVVYISEEKFNDLKQKFGVPNGGDMLISAVGTIGSTYLIKSNDKFYFKDGNLMWLKNISSSLNKNYLLQYFRSNNFQKLIDVAASGSSQKALTIVKFKLLPVLIPPLPEQQKIAEILSTTDQKIEVIDQQIAETQVLKKGLMQKLLTKGIGHTKFKNSVLGEIPESWEISILESHSKFITKGSTPTTYGFDWVEKGVLFLRSECVSPKGFVLSGAMHISDEANQTMERSQIQGGDILMTITGNVGRVCIYPIKYQTGNINQHIARIRIIDKCVDNKFVFQFLSQPALIANYLKITTGQAYPQLSLKQVREITIPLPPLPEQQKIASILSTVDDKIEVLQDKKAEYQELKKGLMQQLLTGKTRVKLN